MDVSVKPHLAPLEWLAGARVKADKCTNTAPDSSWVAMARCA